MYELIYDVLDNLSETDKVFWIDLTTDSGVSSNIWSDFLSLLSEIESLYPDGFGWFAVQTDEGNGVIHFLIKNVYLPADYYSNVWSRIHHSYIVRKREVVKDLFVDGVLRDGFDSCSVYLSTQDFVERIDFSDLWFSDVRLLELAYKFKSSVDGCNKRLF